MTVFVDDMPVCVGTRCTNKVPGDDGALLCSACVGQLVRALGALCRPRESDRGELMPTLVDEVRTTLHKQGKVGGASLGVSVRVSELSTAMGDQRAAAALDELRVTLAGVVRVLWDANRPTRAPLCVGIAEAGVPFLLLAGFRDLPGCGDTIESMAEWLALRPSWMAEHPMAKEIHTWVNHTIDRCWRVIDRPEAKLYRGGCDVEDCTGDVFLTPGRKLARCRACGAAYVAEDRAKKLLKSAMRLKLTAAEIARALPALMQRPLSVQTIHSWARRGVITPAGRNDRGWPTYSVEAVVAVALQTPTRNRKPRHAEVGQGRMDLVPA